MFLENGERTKGEVHWIISFDTEKNTHYVECPTISYDKDDDGNLVRGEDWKISTIHKGTFMECVDFIRSIAKFDDPNYDPFTEA